MGQIGFVKKYFVKIKDIISRSSKRMLLILELPLDISMLKPYFFNCIVMSKNKIY